MSFPRKSRKPRAAQRSGLYNYAVKALGPRIRTEVELRRLMTARAEQGESGAAAECDNCAAQGDGYLDDRAFAETYARLRQENEKLGARRVRQDCAKRESGGAW